MAVQVPEQDPRNQYTAIAAQTIFAYTFLIFVKEDVTVDEDGVILSEGTDYTVSGIGNTTGGNITFIVPRAGGEIITIYRDMAAERLNDYQQNGDFLADEVDEDFNRLWAFEQQRRAVTELSIRADITDTVLNETNTILADVNTRAGKNFGFDASGLLEYKTVSVVDGDARFTTLAVMKAVTTPTVGTDVFIISDRVDGVFDTILGVGTANGFNIIANDAATHSFVLRLKSPLVAAQWGVTEDGVTNDKLALQAVLDGTTDFKKVVISDGAVININFEAVTIPAGVTLEGSGEILGMVVVGGDNVSVRDITITGQVGDDANGFNGFNCVDWGDLLVDNVTFNLCTVINTNDKLVFKRNYRYHNCKFVGDMLTDTFAATFSAGNLAELFVTSCTFAQDNLYRLLKITSIGYAVLEPVDDSFNRRIIFAGNSMAGSMRAVDPNDIIDTFSSATKTIFTDNVITTTGGVDVFASKAGGGSGPTTTQHREIIITNNVIRCSVSQVIMTMAGAVGQTWEDEEQNIAITNNQILCSNNSATAGIEVRAYHRAIVANNDVTYTGTFANFSAIKIRSTRHANLSGGLIKNGNVLAIGDPTEGEIIDLAVTGLTIIEGTGRGIDLTSMTDTNVVISGCNIDASGNNPIRVKDSDLNYLVTSGNVNDDSANGVNFNLGTTVKHVDVGNIWN